jgi:predicted choloylglycine hydrolase
LRPQAGEGFGIPLVIRYVPQTCADAGSVVAACLRPPLYATRFGEGFGTLYTAEYRPSGGLARYYWPGQTWEHSLDRL